MAAPDLTQRFTVFVQKQGTDNAGANPVGAPFSRLTIAAALADLAANYPAADSVNIFHIVALGPGNYAEDVVLPPGTFINGSCDGEGQPTSIITVVSAGITLSAGWSANATAVGGLANLTIRKNAGTPALDFTLPVPVAGNPARTLSQQNVRHNLPSELFEATSTADVLRKTICNQDGSSADTFIQTGGASAFEGVRSAAVLTIRDKTSFAASGTWQGVITGAASGITANSVAAAGCTLRMSGCQPRNFTLSKTAPGVLSVSTDAVSLPINAVVNFTGTAARTDITYLDDAYAVGYTPAVPGNWSPPPTNVQEALDQLGATTGGGGTGTFAYIVRTGNRSSAAWGTNGVAFNGVAGTFTDSTSVAGPVATAVAHSFGVPIFTSAVAVVYGSAYNAYIAGDPVAGGAATFTNTYALGVAGKIACVAATLNAPVIIGAVSNATTYGLLTFNGVMTLAGSKGLFGTTQGGDANLYYAVPTGGDHRFRINNSDKVTLATSGNLLLGGLTTDGTGVLQFPAATTSAGGITMGIDINIFRSGAGVLATNANTISPTTSGGTSLGAYNLGFNDLRVRTVQAESGTGNQSFALNQSVGVSAGVSAVIGFHSGAAGASTLDSAFSRVSAGVIGVGTGAAGSIAGSLSMAALTASGAILGGSLKTAAPTGGAGVWILGKYTAGALVQAGSVLVNIDGTDRTLLTA